MFAGDVSGLWAYTQALEERVAQMERSDREKQSLIATLATSLEALQKQVNPPPPPPQEGEAVDQQ